MRTRTRRRVSGLKPQASSLPCPHPAGSPAKLAAMRERLAARQPLFHPDDNPAIAGKLSCANDQDPLLEAMRLFAPIETRALASSSGATNTSR